MKTFPNGKETLNLLMAFGSVAIIPVTVWLTRPRPLAAESVPQLVILARESKPIQEEATAAMRQRFNAWNANEDPVVRWQKIESSMTNQQTQPAQAKTILQAAQTELKQGWPCFATRGYLRNQPVWLVGSSSPYDNGFLFCGFTTTEERQEHEIEKFTKKIQIVVVNAEAPYQLLRN